MQNVKQAYHAPELKEWGAVADVTQVAVDKGCKFDCANGSVYDYDRMA